MIFCFLFYASLLYFGEINKKNAVVNLSVTVTTTSYIVYILITGWVHMSHSPSLSNVTFFSVHFCWLETLGDDGNREPHEGC